MRFNIKIIKLSHYNVYNDVVKNSHTIKHNHITHNVKCLLTKTTESKAFHTIRMSVDENHRVESFPHHTQCLLTNHTV